MVMHPSGDYGGYADCYQQNGGHHFYESIKNELESFRLRGADDGFSAAAADLLLNDDTSSIASKKRIDSMFRTTASAAGDEKRTANGRATAAAARRTRSLAADGNYGYATVTAGAADADDADNNKNNKNTVQEKIEKMFAEISSSELDTDVSMDSAVPSNKFHVQYIGCAGLMGKISSLEGLQQPVRDMYFGYRENQHHRYPRDDDDFGDGKRRDFSGLLEISATGLSIRYRDDRGDTVHRTNPFPTIAVWAALKYVCRKRSSHPQRRTPQPSAVAGGYEYAFLPLIADPDGSDKAPLFRDMDAGDRARLDAGGDHAPVFAVVTRKSGKRLECHGFACETENDALLMAANLYGALVAAMSSAVEDVATAVGDADAGAAEQQRALTSTRRVIRQRNGFTSMSSTAGSSVCGGDVASTPPPPPRPPRRNKKSVSSAASSVAGDALLSAAADDVCGDAKTFRMTVRQSPSLRRGVCNSSSPPVTVDVSRSTRNDSGGDILTKVAIPRSKSFLNSNGLASAKYFRRAAGFGFETAAADRRRRRSNGSSVMGFSDMFNELRVQEGLNNMDDILNAIINVEGMSYNDLKPIYREFLMKLSMTLTKDELYHRTKAIMTKQKRKRNKQRPTVVASVAGRGRRWNDKLRVTLNLRAARSRIGAVFLPDFCKRDKRDRTAAEQQRSCPCNTSAAMHRHLSSATEVRPANRKSKRRAVTRKRSVAPAVKGRRLVASSPTCSTSDDSDFFAAAALRQRQQLLQQQQQHQQQQLKQSPYRKSKTRGDIKCASGSGRRRTTAATVGAPEASGCPRPASSGYFSCSECSAGAVEDKCYCGAGAAELASLVSCSCDSDSCADSDKCYCGKPRRRPRNIFDELKSRGFAASESSVSRADSPGTAWKKNELLMLLQRHDSGPGGGSSASAATAGGGTRCGVESSKSIEYLQVARRPVVDQHYSSVVKPPAGDRMKLYGASPSNSSITAAGSSSSPASSLSAATVYSSSSAVGVGHLAGRRRRSGSSGSDNFRAIDYTLFATNSGAVGAKSRASGAGHRLLPPSIASANKRSLSSEAVHLSGCRVYHHGQPHRHQTKSAAVRRHSVQHAADDVLSSFFKSDIENSLGYYP
ncbi:uncharacterized protein LOC112686868 [Sipha flava]|uniref:Uncharacterized protein LOC112686868 n=1 Tax=Sipha flava TaxID=143950 RepID=A0A2S2Q0M3_9HEMI|nr:uncharacterized protein LOC112686868 [Sipha flava]